MRRLWVWVIALAGTAALAVAFFSVAQAAPAPAIPHGVAGQEKCLMCHGAAGVKPAPAAHAGFAESTCLACHSAAATPPPSDSPGPAPGTNVPPSPTPTAPTILSQDSCLACHGQPGVSLTLANGEKLSLHVDREGLSASIHGDKLLCTDCHTSVTTYPHPKRDIASLREYDVAQYELCKRCHFANYSKTLDSIHYTTLSSGDLEAPLCTDCHGAHDVGSPSQPRANISRTCSSCHEELYDLYAGSIHGKALEENNSDVPVCTDCHKSHDIEDPRTAAFRSSSVDLCGNCHSNRQLMSKYGISSNVLKSYLEDFHGRNVSLMAKQDKDIWVEEPVCTDCHGVHDIQRVDDPDSQVIKENLVVTCQGCHPGATANFSGAWLSHYDPSMSHAQSVFVVRWFYWLLLPFILFGLSIHILLDLWRAITNR